jgi:hypothetical protein
MDILIANFFELKEKVLFNKMGRGHHLYGGGFGSLKVKYGGYGSHGPNLIWGLNVLTFLLIYICFVSIFVFYFDLLCALFDFFPHLSMCMSCFFALCVNITRLISI